MTFDGKTGEEAGRKKGRKGFAAMDPRKVSAIASMGGKAAHAAGTAHEFSPEEARAAGRKGGHAAAKALREKREREEKGEAT